MRALRLVSARPRCPCSRRAIAGLWGLVLLIALASPPGYAQGLADLGAVTVPVPDQTEAARESAFAEAVGPVLARLTGRPEVAGATPVQGIVQRAGRFVQQFRYERGPEGELRMLTRFDTEALREALVRAGVPVWQRDRPPVLVWLAVERGGQRALAGEGDSEARLLREAAAEVGVPLLFPLLDLEDQRSVTFADVAGGFDGPILEASDRYQTPVVLAGRLTGDGGANARWTLYGPDGGRERWRDQAGDLAQLAAGTARRLAAALREPYTLLPDLDSSTRLEVQVEGVAGLTDLAATERLLQGLGGVSGVRAAEIEGTAVRFQLSINVAPGRVREALGRESRLQAMDQGASGGDAGTAGGPVYRLRR